MAKANEYVVVAPYVTLKCRDIRGGLQVLEFYQGATVPEEADAESLKSLLDKNMVAEVGSEDADLAATGKPLAEAKREKAAADARVEAEAKLAGKASTARTASTSDDTSDEVAADTTINGRPKASASKEEWVTYAVDQRGDLVSEEDARAAAEAKTKADLVAEFGKPAPVEFSKPAEEV